VEAARGVLTDFDRSGWFVELASVSNRDLVPSTVASALGLKLRGEISAESVARAVGARQFLLVLDNCEHVIDAAADLAEQFTRLCPYTTILATSRELPRIAGEAVYRVPPLDVPAPAHETPDDIIGHSAQAGARLHLEQALLSYPPGEPGREIVAYRDIIRFGTELWVMAHVWHGRVLWLQGLADQAARAAETGIEEALATAAAPRSRSAVVLPLADQEMTESVPK
jgi:hypothetical protein